MADEIKTKEDKNSAPCSVCYKRIEDVSAASLLTMWHFGTPRYLCADCEELIETIEKSRDVEKIEAAMARLGENVSNNSLGDGIVLKTVEDIFKSANERAEKIKAGTYDFALDEIEEESVLDEIPEELLETEEDKKKTEREEAINKKFGKIMDIVTIATCAAAFVALIVYIILK